MMRRSLILAVVFLAAVAGVADADTGAGIFESSASVTPEGQIDKLVMAKLARLGIHPALCSDAVFVRRVYLDVIGTLPTAKEARDFIADPDTKNKRRLLIDRLLERDEFADYWAMKWGDILRIKAEFPVNLWPNAAQAYHRYVHASIAANKPYDQFAREMLTSSGSNFRVGPVNFYRAIQNRTPEGIATAVALTFMGTRVRSRNPPFPDRNVESPSIQTCRVSSPEATFGSRHPLVPDQYESYLRSHHAVSYTQMTDRKSTRL